MNYCKMCKCEIEDIETVCGACFKIGEHECADHYSEIVDYYKPIFIDGATVTAINSRIGHDGRWYVTCYCKMLGLQSKAGKTEIEAIKNLMEHVESKGEVWPPVTSQPAAT